MQSADGRFQYWDLGHNLVAAGTLSEKIDRFAYRCRAHGGFCSLNLRGRGHDLPQKSWTWNGDIDKPTLSPSINCQTEGCGWHGFIEDGIYKDTNKMPEIDQGVR